MPDATHADDTRARHVPLQDPELPKIVPVAAAGNTTSARVSPNAAISPMPAVVTATVAQRPRANIGDPRRPGSRAGARAGARAVAVDDRDAVRSNAGLWGLGALLPRHRAGGPAGSLFPPGSAARPESRACDAQDLRAARRTVGPNWDLRAYELRQWGASDTVPVAGTMTVRASIKNRASYAQPLPLLRIDLEDRLAAVSQAATSKHVNT